MSHGIREFMKAFVIALTIRIFWGYPPTVEEEEEDSVMEEVED